MFQPLLSMKNYLKNNVYFSRWVYESQFLYTTRLTNKYINKFHHYKMFNNTDFINVTFISIYMCILYIIKINNKYLHHYCPGKTRLTRYIFIALETCTVIGLQQNLNSRPFMKRRHTCFVSAHFRLPVHYYYCSI